MRFNKRPVRELILPSTAGPDDPSTIIGPDIKQALKDYYNDFGFSVVSNMIFQLDGDDYNYIAQVTAAPLTFLCFGVVGHDLSNNPYTIEAFRFSSNPSVGSQFSVGVTPGTGSITDLAPAHFAGDVTFGGEVGMSNMTANNIIQTGLFNSLSGSFITIDTGTTFTYKGDPLELWMGAQILQPSSNLVKTDTTMQDVPGLSFTIGTGKVYIVECYMALAGPTAANAKFVWSPTGSHVMRRHMVGMAAGTNDDRSAQVLMTRRDIGTVETVGVGTAGGTGSASYRETGILFAASNSTLNFQFAQATADPAGTTLFAASSFIRVQRVQ